ncbi:MAG TPA: 2-C-methyl-D-erythritol 2,4-cyclodiphosphate synthase [Vicinamibacteria bacterium]|nr:2-C-methyl-D-erythritol 2,4-cyclodiphosphate synthase [Vicinamibacteria bacterium]
MSVRVGSGFDAHRLAPGRKLMLGGVEVPHDRGLLGHSDGDCLAHAVCDALLGAAGAGDMGRHFPSRDGRWKDAPSVAFARETARLVRERGYEIENVDATVIAAAPTLEPHLAAMSGALATALGIDPERVSVKAKSSDGLGAVGRGEGIAAMAVALLRQGPGSI